MSLQQAAASNLGVTSYYTSHDFQPVYIKSAVTVIEEAYAAAARDLDDDLVPDASSSDDDESSSDDSDEFSGDEPCHGTGHASKPLPGVYSSVEVTSTGTIVAATQLGYYRNRGPVFKNHSLAEWCGTVYIRSKTVPKDPSRVSGPNLKHAGRKNKREFP